MSGELRVLVLALLPTLSRQQQSPLAKKRMDRSSMMVLLLAPLSASLPRSHAGSLPMPHMDSLLPRSVHSTHGLSLNWHFLS